MGMPIFEPSEITLDNAITNIVESVALEQAALSHILNAEGEKIQKFVSLPCANPEDMLKANKSVNKVIKSITSLEMILLNKLDLFSCYVCNDEI